VAARKVSFFPLVKDRNAAILIPCVCLDLGISDTGVTIKANFSETWRAKAEGT